MKISWINRWLVRLVPPLLEKAIRCLPPRYALEIRQNTTLTGRLDYDKADIRIRTESLIEYDTRLHSCKKEPETVAWVESFGPGEVLYDVGANVGSYALVAALAPGSTSQIYAFEPGFENYARLCANISLNTVDDRIMAIPIALSNKTTLNKFNYSTVSAGGALHSLGNPVDLQGEEFDPVLVQGMLAYCLDDLVKEFELPMPNHIKIDVDGIELEIIEGAQKTLASPDMKTLLVELVEGSAVADATVANLGKLDFNVSSKHKYKAGGESGPFSKVYNYIFERSLR